MTAIYDALAAAIRAEEPVALVTVIDGLDGHGAKLLVRPGAEPLGTLGEPELDRVAHRDALAELECDLAQGYYISRPLPAVEFAGWLNHPALV